MNGSGLALCVVMLGLVASSGCRANPVNLAMMAMGDAVDDADVRERRDQLIGKGPEAANEMFGRRLETLVDTERSGRELLIYLVEGVAGTNQRYVVETKDDEIVALSKTIRNIDGMGDVLKTEGLQAKLLGRNHEDCEREAGLGKPVATLRSRQKRDRVRIYDVRDWSNLRGARYCMLRFDAAGRCHEVRLIGVSASTKKDPARE